MAQSKPRPGPWELHPVTCKSGRNKLALRASGRHICDISIYDDDDEANAALFAEAGTVAHETGLTPRQLAEQRDELLAALADILFEDSGKSEEARLLARIKARAAIAKAEGGAS